MDNIFTILRELSSRMGKYKLTRLFHSVLQKIGIMHLVHYLFSLWFHKNPTKKMMDERKFFLEHTHELKEAYDSLEDERSRSVFENILKYRIMFDWSYLKKGGSKNGPKNQYFVSEISFSGHEVIVDCGAYKGDTVKLFYKKIPGCRVIALEPDEHNFALLQKMELEGLKPIKCGAWSEDTTLNFSDNGGGTGSGTINASGNTKIEGRALDNLPECQTATYIKMDIEGAEMEALRGAENIIKKNHPKLAICIYHHPQDFFEIPLFIKKLNSDYKLFVYHHHYYSMYETVLYAV